MASFTEKAVLLLQDDSTPNIKKINRALNELFKTASKMRNMKLDIDVKPLNRATGQVRKLRDDLNSLSRRAVNVRVNADVRAAETALNRVARNRMASIGVNTVGGIAGVNAIPRPTWGHSIGRDIGFGFRASIGNRLLNFAEGRVREGVNAADIGDVKIELQQLPASQRRQVEDELNRLAGQQRATPTGQVFSEGQQRSLFAEALGVTKGDVAAARALTNELIEMSKLGVAQGQAAEAAVEGAINFGKAAEQMGRLTDASGKFDPSKAARFFDFMRQVAPTIGKEFTGEFVRNASKYLQASKFALSDRELAKVLLLNEESGTSASVGFNQLMKQLSGERVQTKQLNNLIDLGLITPKQAKAGEMGGFSFTELVSGGAVDEETLRTNLSVWVDRQLVPALEKAGVNFADGLNDAERTIVSKFAGAITSDRTATSALVTLLDRGSDLNRSVDQIMARNGSAAASEQAMRDSSRLAMQRINSSFESLAGNVSRTIEPVLLPVMDRISSQVNSMADFAKAGTPQALLASATALTTAVTAASFVTPAIGLKGLASENENTRLLGAIAINTANTTNLLGGLKGLLRFAGPVAGAALGGAAFGGAVAVAENTETGRAIRAGEMIGGLVKPLSAAEANLAAIDRQLKDATVDLSSQSGMVREMARERVAQLSVEKAIAQQAVTRAKAEQSAIRQIKKIEEDRASRSRLRLDATSTADEKENFKARGFSMREVTEQFGGADKVREIQARVGAFVDGVFGPQTATQYFAAMMESAKKVSRVDTLSAIKDESAAPPVAGSDQFSWVTEPVNHIADAFGIGATDIATAGQEAGTAIANASTTAGMNIGSAHTTGGQSAAQMIRDAHVAGAQAVAAALQNAAANIKVNVQQNGNNFSAPNTGGPVGGRLGGPV